MKNLILQTYYHDESNRPDEKLGCYVPADDLAKLSEERFRIYADSIGADYHMIDEAPYKFNPSPAWSRFKMFDLCLEGGYDNVCYIDADILPSKRALGNSIFEWDGHGKLTERDEGSKAAWHINWGVVKFTADECKRMKWKVADKKYQKMYERTGGKNQDAGNQMFYDTFKKRPVPLSPQWNMTRPWHRDAAEVEFRGWMAEQGGYFAHFIGAQKTKGNFGISLATDSIYNEDWS